MLHVNGTFIHYRYVGEVFTGDVSGVLLLRQIGYFFAAVDCENGIGKVG